MKVLFSDNDFSYLTPGGKQVHAEKLFSNLKIIGVDVNYENWHEPSLTADIVHFFGYNDFNKIKTLKQKGYKLVYTHVMDGLTNLSSSKKNYHYFKNKLIKHFPEKLNPIFPWKALKYFDVIVYMHENDRKTAVKLYDVETEKTYVIPHAVDSLEKFSGAGTDTNKKYLVSLGSIVPRKNMLFTAEVCRRSNIPIIFIGHPFDEGSDYYKKFISLVDSKTVQYLGYVTEKEKIDILKNASGFVLLSFGESGCISVYEAAAAGLPLLLSDLPWAKAYKNPNNINFCNPLNSRKAQNSMIDFFQKSARQKEPTIAVSTWLNIAEKYAEVYSKVLE